MDGDDYMRQAKMTVADFHAEVKDMNISDEAKAMLVLAMVMDCGLSMLNGTLQAIDQTLMAQS